MSYLIARAGSLLFASVLVACGSSADQPNASTVNAVAALPTLMVYKNESCGCCRAWVSQMHHAGFRVEVHNVDNLGPTKERVGIPAAMGSCHTAEVAGYFVEGHVPAADVTRLLAERPNAKGLTVPGMPVGSPGMEAASGKVQPYDVLLVAKDGTTTVFAHHE